MSHRGAFRAFMVQAHLGKIYFVDRFFPNIKSLNVFFFKNDGPILSSFSSVLPEATLGLAWVVDSVH